MITNLDPTSELFLANVARIQQQIADANRQVSSGKKIASPSDAPDQIDSLLQLRAAQARNSQIQSNLVLANADATGADNSLAAAIKLMDSAVTLAQQGTGMNTTDAVRQSLAQQVQTLQEEMVNYSQASVQGRYIFGGDQGGTAPYSFDITSTNNAVVQNTSSPATAQVEDPAGGSFSGSKTAEEIFDTRNADGTPATDNVFAALNNLRIALLSNDTTAIAGAIDPITQASSHLNSMEAFYGSTQDRIQTATDFAANNDVQIKTQISQKEDADIAAEALSLTQANSQLQAAFEMRAKIPATSLFNYLA